MAIRNSQPINRLVRTSQGRRKKMSDNSGARQQPKPYIRQWNDYIDHRNEYLIERKRLETAKTH